MKTHDGSLFQIGEVMKILGVTRKTLLVYEDMGLLTPAVKDEDNGFRFYTADNMTQIRSIRSLQALGLSLKEVAALYGVSYPTVRLRLDRLIQKIQISETAEADPYVSLIKRLAVDDKLDFDTAKILIGEYRRQKGET